MALNKAETRDLYRKRAKRYDRAMWIYRAFGFRIDHYRRELVRELHLEPGDTVIDLGCGTGLNFPLIEAAVGPSGTVVGVDLTDRMLDRARRNVEDAGWRNVHLVQADLAEYDFPERPDAVLSTLAITLVPEYDEVVRRAARALRAGGRLGVLDFKEPETWPRWLVRLAAWLNHPYGVTLDLADRHPWESVRRHMEEVSFREFYFGVLYLCVGQA